MREDAAVRNVVFALAACAAACALAPLAPSFDLATVNGRAVPFQVGVTTTGQPLIIYSGTLVRDLKNGQCNFSVKLDKSEPLYFVNEYFGTEPGECILEKGEPTVVTHTFKFRDTADSSSLQLRYQ